MKGLKGTLIGIYAALIILAILMNLPGCHRQSDPGIHDTIIERWTDTVVVVDTVAADTVSSEEIPDTLQGERGQLRVALLWDFRGDVDLHVVQPNGRCVDYKRHLDGSTTGNLDIDNRRGGSNSAENINWDVAPEGVYKVYLNYYSKTGEGDAKVVVQTSEGNRTLQQKAFTANMTRKGQWEAICTFEYRNGRLTFSDPSTGKPTADQCKTVAAGY
ncbi:MAG: hypothetical protein NC097_04500 [Clostridium sp.]|nr:hypothetical protein [Prevotella sp.]MCM1429038.1 hypothetical protein [Clostridium sp.]MCM1475431.1 hypothetical protein [Muribaculaceae bacterium]